MSKKVINIEVNSKKQMTLGESMLNWLSIIAIVFCTAKLADLADQHYKINGNANASVEHVEVGQFSGSRAPAIVPNK